MKIAAPLAPRNAPVKGFKLKLSHYNAGNISHGSILDWNLKVRCDLSIFKDYTSFNQSTLIVVQFIGRKEAYWSWSKLITFP